MGCVTSFIYKSEHYEHILWYSELFDIRFQNIYVKKTEENLNGYILKKVHKEEQQKYLKNQQLIEQIFNKYPEFILKIKGFQNHMVKVASSHEEKLKLNNQNFTYMKIEYFEKDLSDDVNIKSLKNRFYEQDEIWNLIYFSIFIFAELEKNLIPIPKIERQNYLIHNKKLKYYLASLFNGTISNQSFNENDIKIQYLSKLREFNYVLLSTINIISYHDSLKFSLDELLNKAKQHVEEKLFDFIKEILVENKKDFNSFKDLQSYIVFLYPTFHSLFFDPLYISLFQN